MSKNERNQPLKKEPKSDHPHIDLVELADQIAQGRVLSAEMARLVFELEKCATEVSSKLRELRTAQVIPFPPES